MLDNPHFKDQLSDYIIMQEKWIKDNKTDYNKVDDFHEKEVELKDYYSKTVVYIFYFLFIYIFILIGRLSTIPYW